MQTINAIKDGFVKLLQKHDEAECLKYIDKYDNIFNHASDSIMLHFACVYGLKKVAIALIDKKCNLIYQDDDEYTALMYAHIYKLHDIVAYIIDNISDSTTRVIYNNMSEMMYISSDTNNIIKMIDKGYDIYYENEDQESLMTVAIDKKLDVIVKKLIDVDTDFIEKFEHYYYYDATKNIDIDYELMSYHVNMDYPELKIPKSKKTEFYIDIRKYCDDKRATYRDTIIAVINDKSATNALYKSFHTTYAVQLVDIICDFLILPTIKS
ncbi:MAG: hypothetical protein Faunusvirus13_9 [Faunusvirus sp.]|jgi:hypothetical protein|uniref:Ankyrin repeat protein n=1 Tax=Faunusvirus sp. TaxID=2487766 RepID=A0A3G4ZWY4_9VIRU|nr:MAG: hypothetical protein Faunusvirus13_9 [Faunusvirus sp.]